MKVKIGKYKNWFGPYQLAEFLCFWAKDIEDKYGLKDKPDFVYKFGEWLAHGSVEPDPPPFENRVLFKEDRKDTWLYRLLLWINEKKKRTEYVRIDKWDTWSMDHTLGLIILPMLKQLHETKQGAPQVDLEDVPEHLRPTKEELESFEIDGSSDPNFFKRWDWIMDEMIFAFEHVVDDEWKSKYYSGEYDLHSKPIEWDEEGKAILFQMVDGPNHTAKTDFDAIKEIQKRIDRGLLFFGKYYSNLWD